MKKMPSSHSSVLSFARVGAALESAGRSLMSGLAAAAVAITLAVALTPSAQAAEAGMPLDHFPESKLKDKAALQDGARTFVNYCQTCHGAALMRYNRLQDIGLSDIQIRDGLIFDPTVKVGDTMTTAMRPQDAKVWFGALPPDLSVITRARSSGAGSGSDWLYTYLRTFYRDASRATGWNNAVFPNVGMPHALWHLQGSRGATIEEVKADKDADGKVTGYTRHLTIFDTNGLRTEKKEELHGGHGHESTHTTLGSAQGGSLSQPQFDETVANLVAFLTYVSDPSAAQRARLGVWVLMFITLLMGLAWWLNREYWKDVK